MDTTKVGDENNREDHSHLTTTSTARKYCLSCVGNSFEEVKNCTDKSCAFYPHRLGRPRVPLWVIRKFCRQCTSNGEEYIRNCPSKDCLCYPYRMGKNPFYKLTDEDKERRVELLRLSRKKIL